MADASGFKRNFAATLAWLLLSFIHPAWTQAADRDASNQSKKPNFVFIIADDLGWGDVGFHGGFAATPVLDQLAKSGLELRRHYVAPVCSPTRTGLMTGRVWSRFGVTSPQNELALPWETVTLPRALKSAGYETCLTGKWHLGSLPEHGPNHFGFDHSYGSLAGGVSPWNHRYKQGPFTQTWHRNEKLIEETGHVTDLITAEAVQWIEARGDAPFFLYVPFTAVHLPIKEPEEWLNKVPANIRGDVARHYAACVMHLDNAVGKILDALERKGKRDNTLVVFTSDNGGSTVENNDLKYPDDNCPNGKLVGSSKPWRGEKGSLYEGGIRVPTVASWPNQVKPGALDFPVQITDWMPTFCSFAQVPVNPAWKCDGQDLSSALRGLKLPEVRPIYSVAPGWRSRSLHVGTWKLIANGEGSKQVTELYNLADDPTEKNDLVAQQPERVKQMLEQLALAAAADRDSVAPKKK